MPKPWEVYAAKRTPPTLAGKYPAGFGPRPETVSSISDAIVAGYQGSATGLMLRGKLPDLVLDEHHSTWAQRMASMASQTVSEIPEMVVGGAAVGAVGTAIGIETGPGALLSGAVGVGAGAMAMPTLIRETLMQAYSRGEVQSAADFLDRVSIVAKATTKDAIIGALTGKAGAVAGEFARGASLGGKAVAGPLTAGAAQGVRAASMGAEYGTMVVAPALLEGRLPEPEEFLNAAIMIGGMKGAHGVMGKMQEIYARTGRTPLEVVNDAKANPELAAELRGEKAPEGGGAPQDPGMPWAYVKMGAEQAAAEAFPGTRAAEVMANPFGGPVNYERSPYQLNMKYLQGPEDFKMLQQKMSEVYAKDKPRTWAEVEKTVEDLALATGLDKAKIVEQFQSGNYTLDVQARVMKHMQTAAAEDAYAAAKAVREAGANATPEQKAEFTRAVNLAGMLTADYVKNGTEVARALAIRKELVEFGQRLKGIDELNKMYGGNLEAMAEAMAKLDSPDQVSRFAKNAHKATRMDKLHELYVASLVSGTAQIWNIASNVTLAGIRPVTDVVASLPGVAKRLVDPTAKVDVYASEAMGRVIGDLQVARDMVKILGKEPVGPENTWAKVGRALTRDASETKSGHPIANEGQFGYWIRTPLRMLEAGDQLFRTMAERGEIHAQAFHLALDEGFQLGTREFQTRVAELVANPPEKVLDAAQAVGARDVLRSPMGKKGELIQKAIKGTPARWAVPFVGTPLNAFKEMARLSPAAPIIGEWRADIAKGGAPAARAYAEMALGTSISALAMGLAMSGNISGAGDPDPNKRRVQQASGWQPYSVKLNGTWYSYQRLQPIGPLVGMAADISSAWHYMNDDEQDKAPKILATAFANAITKQTFLQGLAGLVEALDEPDRKAGRFIQSTVASFVPAAIGQTTREIDPYKRQVDSILEAVMARIPGLRQTLPVQRDPFGEAVREPGVVLPTTEQGADPVRLEAARLGVGVARAPKSVTLPSKGYGLGKVELTPHQRDIFGEKSGQEAHAMLARIIADPDYMLLSQDDKVKLFKNVFERANKIAALEALSPERRAQEQQRIAEDIIRRQSKH